MRNYYLSLSIPIYALSQKYGYNFLLIWKELPYKVLKHFQCLLFFTRHYIVIWHLPDFYLTLMIFKKPFVRITQVYMKDNFKVTGSE